jgi:membrane-associated protease RseP (regulator of RpoE activity)
LKAGNLILALAAALALHAGRAAAQGGEPPRPGGVLHHTAIANGNPANGSVARTFGFAWGMSTRPGPDHSPTFGHPYVTVVVPGSNAARAGLVVGDTIVSVNGRDTRQPPLFPVRRAGTEYVLLVRRGGEERELTYVFPEPQRAAP